MARHAKKIDTVHWTGFDNPFVALTAGTVGATALPAQHLPETLLRIRGEWAAAIGSAAAPVVGVIVTAGLILVPEGTSTTVLWSPLTDSDAPWVWWDCFHILYSEQVADVVYSVQTSSARRVVDSKAMRKVRNRELQLVVENTTMTGFSGEDVSGGICGRVLSGS